MVSMAVMTMTMVMVIERRRGDMGAHRQSWFMVLLENSRVDTLSVRIVDYHVLPARERGLECRQDIVHGYPGSELLRIQKKIALGRRIGRGEVLRLLTSAPTRAHFMGPSTASMGATGARALFPRGPRRVIL